MSTADTRQDLVIERFHPVRLRVRNVGPFRSEAGETLDLLADEGGEPANFFLLAGDNGSGKSTLLECLVWLYQLLFDSTATADWLEDAPDRDLELSIVAHARLNGADHRVLLVIVDARRAAYLGSWRSETLNGWSVTEAVTVGIIEGVPVPPAPLVEALRSAARSAERLDPTGAPLRPELPLPTLLYFPSQRDVLPLDDPEARALARPAQWPYKPVRRFGLERTWSSALDFLLTWLYWLDLDRDHARFRHAVDVINHTLFRGTTKFIETVDRPRLVALVNVGQGQTHRLDQLSSGERNLVQLFLRIALHMTRHTLVIIDEIDLHLHPHTERLVTRALHDLSVRRLPGQAEGQSGSVNVLFTSHSTDSMTVFDDLRMMGPGRCGVWLIDRVPGPTTSGSDPATIDLDPAVAARLPEDP